MISKEVEKIRQRYLRRENISNDKRYSFFDKANLFICQERERKIIEIFKKNNFDDLSSKKILDIGCGTGGGGYAISFNGEQNRKISTALICLKKELILGGKSIPILILFAEMLKKLILAVALSIWLSLPLASLPFWTWK